MAFFYAFRNLTMYSPDFYDKEGGTNKLFLTLKSIKTDYF